MWPETRKRTEFELTRLARLLQSNRELLDRVKVEEPDGTELLAVSALVHSFYTGTENIFKRIALEIDQSVPAGQKWHSDLLLQMERATGNRSAVISEQLRLRLGEYMDFRHVFRHAYSFDLKWPKMRGLVVGIDDALRELSLAVEEFFVSSTDN